MVFREELNKRSPLRAFERAIQGGLGKGNIGVVTARKGTGKTAFLVGVAIDHLLRGRKVLHVTSRGSVEQVSLFYDEIFKELSTAKQLEDVAETRLLMERNRHILSYRDSDLRVARIRESMEFLAEHAAFRPEVAILNGFPDFETTPELPRVMDDLKVLAREREVELWINALRHRQGQERDERDVPLSVARVESAIAVIIHLESRGDHVRLRLAKDRDNPNLAELHLELDPQSLLLRWS